MPAVYYSGGGGGHSHPTTQQPGSYYTSTGEYIGPTGGGVQPSRLPGSVPTGGGVQKPGTTEPQQTYETPAETALAKPTAVQTLGTASPGQPTTIGYATIGGKTVSYAPSSFSPFISQPYSEKFAEKVALLPYSQKFQEKAFKPQVEYNISGFRASEAFATKTTKALEQEQQKIEKEQTPQLQIIPRPTFRENPSSYFFDLAERYSQQKNENYFTTATTKLAAGGLTFLGVLGGPAELFLAIKKSPSAVFNAFRTEISGGITNIKTLGIGEYTRQKFQALGTKAYFQPEIVGGRIIGELALMKGTGYVISKTTGYASNVLIPEIQKVFNPKYMTPEATNIKFVPSVSEPISPSMILKREGTTSTGIHVTISPKFKFDEAGEILLKAQPQGSGAKRISLEQFSFYKSLAEDTGKPRAYLAYAGIGEGASESTTKVVLAKPNIRLLVFKDELISPTPKGLSVKGIQQFQGMTTGKTFLGVENIKGLSVEAQTITPSQMEYLVKGVGKQGFVDVRAFDTLGEAQKFVKGGEFKQPIIEYKGYPGSIVKKVGDVGFTYYVESTVPKWMKSGSFLESVYKGLKLDVKSSRLNIIEAKTLPVTKKVSTKRLNVSLPRKVITTGEILSSQSTRYVSVSEVLTPKGGMLAVLISPSKTTKSSQFKPLISSPIKVFSVSKKLSIMKSPVRSQVSGMISQVSPKKVVSFGSGSSKITQSKPMVSSIGSSYMPSPIRSITPGKSVFRVPSRGTSYMPSYTPKTFLSVPFYTPIPKGGRGRGKTLLEPKKKKKDVYAASLLALGLNIRAKKTSIRKSLLTPFGTRPIAV